MNLLPIQTLLTGVIIISVGILSLIKDYKAKLNIMFFLFCLSVFVWLFMFSLMYLSPDPVTALFFARLGDIGILYLPITGYYFVLILLKKEAKFFLSILYSSLVLSVPVLLISQSKYIISGIKVFYWGYYPVAGTFYISIILFFSLALYCIWLLYKGLREQQMIGDQHIIQRIKYVLYAFICAGTGLVDYLPKFGISIYPWGHISALFFILLIAYAILKHHLMDINVVIRKGMVFAAFASICGFIYLVLAKYTNLLIINGIVQPPLKNLYVIAALLALILHLILGLFVLLNSPRKILNRVFFMLSMFIFVWIVGCFVQSVTKDPKLAWITEQIVSKFYAFTPALFLHTFYEVMQLKDKKVIYIGYFLSASMMFLSFSNIFIEGVSYNFGARYLTIPGPFFFLFPLSIAYSSFFSLTNIIKIRKTATGYFKIQLDYLFLAGGLIIAAVFFSLLLIYQVIFTPFDEMLNIAYGIVIGYAILQHRLMDIKVFIRKSLLYSSIIALVTGLYIAFITYINQYLTRIEWNFNISQNALFNVSVAFHQWVMLLTAILSLLLSLIVFIKNRSKAGIWFSVFALLVSLWCYFYYLGITLDDYYQCSFMMRTDMLPGILILPAFTEFVHAFLNIKMNKYVRIVNWSIAFMLMTTVYTDLYCKNGGPIVGFKYFSYIAPFGLINIFHYTFNVYYSEYKLIRALGTTDVILDRQIKYLIYSTCIGFFGAAMNFLLWFNIPFPPIFNVLIPIYILMVAFAILKYKLMDIEIIIRKGLIYSLLIAFLSAFYLSAVFLFGNFLGGRKSAASILFTIFSIIFFSLVFQPLRDKIQEVIDKFFFRGKYDYQKTLKDLSRVARSIAGLDELANKILNSIVETLKINNAAIYVLDKENKEFILRKSIGEGEPEVVLNKDSKIIISLTGKKEPLIFDEPNNKYSIVFPILSKDKLLGLLCLGDKLSGEVYSDEDINLISTLCNQIGVSIENSMLYEDVMETQKQLYQADKLATVGALAAGLAHEIKNPIAAIKGFSQVIGKAIEKNDKEVIEDFKNVVPRQLDRINNIVEKLLTLSMPPKVEKENVNVNSQIEEIIKLIEKQAMKQKVTIHKDLNDIPTVSGEPGQLTQAILNLLLNAIQAMPDGGRVEISTYARDNNVYIEVKDNGVGIAKDNVAHIFDPFYTTKSGGSGLGLAVTRKIVIDHHGRIEVKSEIGKGATIVIELPIG